jgi:hypothetical protein
MTNMTPFIRAGRIKSLSSDGDDGLNELMIMDFQKIILIEEHPPRADKSAMGAINRPLRRSVLLC